MDLFTRCNGHMFREPLAHWLTLAQRIYIRLCTLIKNERTFETFFGSKIRDRIGDFVPKRIFFFGFWEPNLTGFMLRTIQKDDWVVDAGSNIGYYTLLMSHLVGNSGRVVSIEAAPSVFQRLQQNIALNSCTNICTFNLALAEQQGQIKLYEPRFGYKNSGTSTLLKSWGGPDYTVVNSNTLLDVLGAAAKRISFIKIDIEGAERPILNEIIENRDRFAKPLTVVTEIEDEHLDVVEHFRAAGFECYYLSNDYTLAGYLRALRRSTVELPVKLDITNCRPPGAELIFVYGK
ncbi:FkbM family methyltransferase [Bradyrhizobium sp. 164]|uniref:FkbM family methyltransferase n=1 Tax=Bradyrhizobium sp. 164 TaxID=2782637 RepID=UPI001FFAAB75|nr:FkbM family methyltransferase [Bradyrhizobium sp. 164]MCK1597307.1 FkbM family methyltransferase [Bradyrhizobium sp. 164]